MIQKLALTLVVSLLALTPLWMYIGMHEMLNPQGFWQQFFVFGVGVYFLGSLQLFLIIVSTAIVVFIWLDE